MSSQAPARRLRRFVRSPKGVLLLVLIGLVAVAAPVEGIPRIAPVILGAVCASTSIDVGLTWVARRVLIVPSSALLSGLIVALVLSPQAPWYLPVMAGAIAAGSKHLVRTPPFHLFNPAALALLACVGLFPSGQSWWGALSDLPAPALVLLLTGGSLVAVRVNKLAQVLAFIGSYFGMFTLAALLLGGETPRLAEVFRVPLVNAALFFAFFMLTDPPTSPSRTDEQVRFGAVVGVASVVGFIAVPGLAFLYIGLLLGNAWQAWRRARVELTRTGATP